jgi:hypothetical protein
VQNWVFMWGVIVVLHAHVGRAEDQKASTDEGTTQASVPSNSKLDFSLLSGGCLCKPVCRPGFIRWTVPASTNHSGRCEVPLLCAGMVNPAMQTPLKEPAQTLPFELNQHLILRDEFEHFNALPPSPVQGKPADVAATASTNKPLNLDATTLQIGPIPSQPYSHGLFDYRADDPDPHSLIAFSHDYKVVYFPLACASYQRHSLSFDFDRILGHVLGPENVSPIFYGSKLGVAKCSGGLRCTLMLAF